MGGGRGGGSVSQVPGLSIPRHPAVSLDLSLNNSAGAAPLGGAPGAGSAGNGAVAAREDDGSTHGSSLLASQLLGIGSGGHRGAEQGGGGLGGDGGGLARADAGSSHGGTTFLGLSSLLGSVGGSGHGGSVHSTRQVKGAPIALSLLENGSPQGPPHSHGAPGGSPLSLPLDHWPAAGAPPRDGAGATGAGAGAGVGVWRGTGAGAGGEVVGASAAGLGSLQGGFQAGGGGADISSMGSLLGAGATGSHHSSNSHSHGHSQSQIRSQSHNNSHSHSPGQYPHQLRMGSTSEPLGVGGPLSHRESRVHGGRSAFVALRGFQPIGNQETGGPPPESPSSAPADKGAGNGTGKGYHRYQHPHQQQYIQQQYGQQQEDGDQQQQQQHRGMFYSQSAPVMASTLDPHAQFQGVHSPPHTGARNYWASGGPPPRPSLGPDMGGQQDVFESSSTRAHPGQAHPGQGQGQRQGLGLGPLLGAALLGNTASPGTLGSFQGGGESTQGLRPGSQGMSLSPREQPGEGKRGQGVEGPPLVTIKATFHSDTVRFKVPLNGMAFQAVEEEVASRVQLKVGQFSLKYLDEDEEWVVLASEQDMAECIDITRAQGNSVIKLVVKAGAR